MKSEGDEFAYKHFEAVIREENQTGQRLVGHRTCVASALEPFFDRLPLITVAICVGGTGKQLESDRATESDSVDGCPV